MATHSSVLAWRIPGMGEPGGLPSVGSHRVGHDWSDLAAAAAVTIYNIQLKTSMGIFFLPPSDVYVRSSLYLLYTLIKLYYTKALSDQALSLALDWILLLQRPRILGSFRSATTFQKSWERRMELEESTFLTSDYTTKLVIETVWYWQRNRNIDGTGYNGTR